MRRTLSYLLAHRPFRPGHSSLVVTQSNWYSLIPMSTSPHTPYPCSQVTVTMSGRLNIHGWLPFSNSKSRPFTFLFDHNDRCARPQGGRAGGERWCESEGVVLMDPDMAVAVVHVLAARTTFYTSQLPESLTRSISPADKMCIFTVSPHSLSTVVISAVIRLICS